MFGTKSSPASDTGFHQYLYIQDMEFVYVNMFLHAIDKKKQLLTTHTHSAADTTLLTIKRL